ncbi:MAG: F0F1 ATP synthase subunit A [Myxococcales bacterium]
MTALHPLVAFALGAEAEAEQPSVSDAVFGHVTDSKVFELPFLSPIRLPVWPVTVGGHVVDLGPTKHVVWMIIAAVALVLFAWLATRGRGKSLVPSGLANLVEMLVLFVRDEIAYKTMDEHTAHDYLPYLLTAFFFIVFSAGLGLIPYTATSVGNLAVTGSLAIFTFALMQITGIRHQGLGGYLLHLVPSGVPWWMFPLMWPIEILGMLTKTFALCIRLFANMIAGHIVILFILGLVFLLQTPLVGIASVPFAVALYLLEVIIILIQAYIFTMLSALFIGMSAHAH